MWQPFSYRDHLNGKHADQVNEYFLLRPLGTNREGKPYVPSVVRITRKGVLLDAGGVMIRLEHHEYLEWCEIPK